MRSTRVLVLGAILGLFSLPGFAQSVTAKSCDLTDYQPSTRPDPSGTPTEITVGLLLIDLTTISDVDQTVALDALLSLQWTDHRLDAAAGCRYDYLAIWTPGIQLFNSATVASRRPPQILVEANGRVILATRYNASVVSPAHIGDFPFDRRSIDLQLGSLNYATAEVYFSIAEQWTGRRAEMTIPDWRIGEPTADVGELELQRVGRTVSVLNFQIPAERLSEYFVYKFVFPLCLIVMMSWSAFWIDARNLNPQLALAATSMLTLIAYQFTVNSLLPKVGYLTTMDKFVLSSSFLVFLALAEALLTGRLASQGRTEAAEKVDSIARRLFPSIYLVIIVTTLVL